MRRVVACALAGAALAQAAAPVAAREGGPGFLQFSASHSSVKNSEAVTVNVGLFERRDEDSARWQPARDEELWFQGVFAERAWTAPRRFRWTDGKRCPEAVKLLRRVRTLEMPKPVLPIPDPEGFERGGDIYLDGRIYGLKVSSANLNGQAIGGVEMSSNVNTDLAKWVEAMLEALAPCWSTTVPKGADSFRGTAEDAAVNPER